MDAIVERWRRIVASIDPETAEPWLWEDGPCGHFLHAFRPDGARLEELFEGIAGIEPVIERLRVVFRRAGPETGHMYFIVSRPREMDDEVVTEHVRAWLASVDAMRGLIERRPKLDPFFRGEVPIEVSGASGEDSHPMHAEIYEAVTEHGGSRALDHPGLVLVEPLYMLACSYALAYWILWPLTGEDGDPYAPHAALWEAGIELEFVGSGAGARVIAKRSPT